MRNDLKRLSSSDEIDLFEVFENLWKQKLLIGCTVTTFFLASLLYLYKSIPVYEARAFVQPPVQGSITPLNYGRGPGTGLEVVSIKYAYERYMMVLRSEALRREMFRDLYLPSLGAAQKSLSQDDLYERFNSLLAVVPANKENPDRYMISVKFSDPSVAVDWLARYVKLAGEQAKEGMIKDMKDEAKAKADNLQRQVHTAQESARKEREDEITHLKEALAIARSIGLDRPAVILGDRSVEISANMEGDLTYMRGSKALEAAIENLERRSSDDPFIADLRKQQAALSFYRTLDINPDVVSLYLQDGTIETPDKAIRPRKLMILGLFVAAGGGVGLMLALFRCFIVQRARVRSSA